MKTTIFLALLVAVVHAVPQDPITSEETNGNFPTPDLDENGIPVGMALVDGDILIPKEQLPIYEKEGFDGLVKSEAWINGPLWPRLIYFAINIPANTPARADIVAKIIASMNDLNNQQSCLRFVQVQSAVQTRYILFQMGQSCYTMIGPLSNSLNHDIFLHPSCCTSRTPAHEVMHALGRFHEQTRPDRDYFIKVNWPNIIQNCVSQYQRQNQALTLGLGYDYYSVMHYGPTQCAAMPNQPAMIFPQGVNVAMVGRADRLTPTDIAHIIRRYCPSG